MTSSFSSTKKHHKKSHHSPLLSPEDPSATPKIPKKPIVLAVKYTSFSQARYIRVKLWKLKTCHIFQMEPERKIISQQSTYLSIPETWKITHFGVLLSSPTLKKSLKFVRKIKLNLSFQTDFHLKRVFSRSWKLQSIDFKIMNSNFFPQDFIQKHINPKISSISLHLFSQASPFNPLPVAWEHQLLLHLQQHLKKLRKSHIDLTLFYQNLLLKISLGKIYPLIPSSPRYSASLFHPIVFNIQKSIQSLSFTFNYNSGLTLDSTFSSFPVFPHLQYLSINIIDNQGLSSGVNLTFLQSLTKLETLKISLEHLHISSWNFLSAFKSLKNLSIILIHNNTLHSPFPILTTLTSLVLRFEYTQFDTGNINAFIQSNEKLKSLELRTSLQQVNQVFQKTTFQSLERLSIQLCKVDFPFADYIEDFEEIILRHNQIKDLHINLHAYYPELFFPVLHAIGTYGETLEALRVNFETTGQLKDKKYKKMKELFEEIRGLKSLELGLEYELMDSKGFGSVIEGLGMLKNLEHLVFRGNVVKISGSTAEKFMSWVESVRGLKEVDIKVKGLSKKETEIVAIVSGRRCKLWKVYNPDGL